MGDTPMMMYPVPTISIEARRIHAIFFRNISVRIPAGMLAIPDEIDCADVIPPIAISPSPSVDRILGIITNSAPCPKCFIP